MIVKRLGALLRAAAVSLFLAVPAFAAQNSIQVPTVSPLTGLALVDDINGAAMNFVTLNSGSSPPISSILQTSGLSGFVWHDTSTNTIKIRDLGDSTWIVLMALDETNKVATANVPLLASTASLSPGTAEHFGEFVATAAASYGLAQTNTLWNGFAFAIFAQGGNVTVTVNAADKINNGAAGAGMVIPVGYVGEFRTDGAGDWFVHLQPSVLGTGSIASASTTDLCSVANPLITITGTATIASFGSSCQAGQTKIVTLSAGITLAYNASSMILNTGGVAYAAAAGDGAIVEALGASNYRVLIVPASGQALNASPTPLAINGLAPSLMVSPSAALSLTPGSASDTTASAKLALASAASWAAANGAAINGLAGGGSLSASATVHFYICSGTTGTGSMASGWTLNAANPCPSGYNTYYRHIFSLRTDTNGVLIPVTAVEIGGGALRMIYSGGAITDMSAVSFSTTSQLQTFTVPTGVKVGVWFRYVQTSVSHNVVITDPDEADQAPSDGSFTTNPGFDDLVSENDLNFFRTTNTSGQIRFRASGTLTGVGYAFTREYEAYRRD